MNKGINLFNNLAPIGGAFLDSQIRNSLTLNCLKLILKNNQGDG